MIDKLDRIVWFIQRSRSFTFVEICSRILEFQRHITDRIIWRIKDPIPGESKLYSLLGGISPKQLFSQDPISNSNKSRKQTYERYSELLPHRIREAKKELENYLKGNIFLFRKEVDLSRPFPWLIDWESGYAWQRLHWTRINYRWPPKETDVRRTWELNRLHHLVAAAGAAYGLKDSNALISIQEDLENWLIENPPFQGPNWSSSLELGIRLVSFGWLRIFLGRLLAETTEIADLFLGSVWLHAWQILRYPSRHSSRGNHTLGEALGLYAAGVFFPEFIAAESWREKAKRILEDQILQQILPGGGSVEQSTSYLRFVLEIYLTYISLAEITDDQVPDVIYDRVASGLEGFSSLVSGSGELPLIGDNDDGGIIRFGDTYQNPNRSLLLWGGVLLDQTDLIFRSDLTDLPIDERTFWLLTERANIHKDRTLESNNVSEGLSRNLGGLSILNDRLGGHRFKVTLRGGDFGMEPNYGHAHSDLGSLTVMIDGDSFILDLGNYLYFGAPEWRSYFRSIAAHNTVQVDELDQARPLGPFLWDQIPTSELQLLENEKMMESKVEVFVKNQWYLHNRRVRFCGDEIYILDHIQCPGKHLSSSHWHINPIWQVLQYDNILEAQKKSVSVQICFPDKASLELLSGTPGVKKGWWAPNFVTLEPCWLAQSKIEFIDECELITVIKF